MGNHNTETAGKLEAAIEMGSSFKEQRQVAVIKVPFGLGVHAGCGVRSG